MNEKYYAVILSLAIAGLTLMTVNLLALTFADNALLNRIFVLFGGRLPSGIIQGITYFLFVFGIFEILNLRRRIQNEMLAFEMNLLPESEQFVLGPEDVAKLKLNMIEIQRKQDFQLVQLIKKACTKFRSSNSISETLGILTRHSELLLRNSESDQSMIRYIAWAIPSVGFIGTVIGIAASLSHAGAAVTMAGVERVTELLYIAFDTTLVALILSLILMFLYHKVQAKVERYHSGMEEYVIENLVNRIYPEQ
jgi:biopolymer transport protein ExbB/TolQ